jgi:hypothetical protein
MKIRTLWQWADELGDAAQKQEFEDEGISENLVALFDDEEGPFLVEQLFCDNPDCECRHVTISLRATEGSLATTCKLDPCSWVEVDEASRSPRQQRLVDELKRDMTTDVQNRWREDYETARSHKEALRKARIDPYKIDNGVMVAWTSALGRKSVLEKGDVAAFEMTHDGEDYIVEDLHCPVPECRCSTALLIFLHKDHQHKRLEESFTAEMVVGRSAGTLRSLATVGCSRHQARRIWESFVKKQPYLAEDLESHMREVKYVASRTMDHGWNGAGGPERRLASGPREVVLGESRSGKP